MENKIKDLNKRITALEERNKVFDEIIDQGAEKLLPLFCEFKKQNKK